jgi:diadenosine tetraphosphate (Ap4A) HIT family hydrolase
MPDCYTCQLVAQRDTGKAPLWENIYRTQHGDVVHSYNPALLGWTVLVTRRHITAIDDMTES